MTVSSSSYKTLFELVERVAGQLKVSHSSQLAQMFRQCYLNTVETTTELLDDQTTFIFTGDIPAMWLRDSAAQVRPLVAWLPRTLTCAGWSRVLSIARPSIFVLTPMPMPLIKRLTVRATRI